MAENTKIEWATHSWNPWIGCQKVSPGCDHCYAEAWAKRFGHVEWGPHASRRRTSDANWKQPLKWAKKAQEQIDLFDEGMLTLPPPRPRVFCASMADVFDNRVDPVWRVDLLALIKDTPELDWLLLTKRPENIRRHGYLPGTWLAGNPWPNVWLGFTAEDQEHFDRRWPIMREIPAAVRFCSYEPAIGPLRLFRPGPGAERGYPAGLDWLICGGESGPGHRWMEPEWEQDVRLDCERAGISYFFKQMAGKKPIPDGFPLVRQFPAKHSPRVNPLLQCSS